MWKGDSKRRIDTKIKIFWWNCNLSCAVFFL